MLESVPDNCSHLHNRMHTYPRRYCNAFHQTTIHKIGFSIYTKPECNLQNHPPRTWEVAGKTSFSSLLPYAASLAGGHGSNCREILLISTPGYWSARC